MFDDEIALIPSLKGIEAAEVVAKVNEVEEEAIAEALAELEAGTSEDEKDRVSKVYTSAVLLTKTMCHDSIFSSYPEGLHPKR